MAALQSFEVRELCFVDVSSVTFRFVILSETSMKFFVCASFEVGGGSVTVWLSLGITTTGDLGI